MFVGQNSLKRQLCGSERSPFKQLLRRLLALGETFLKRWVVIKFCVVCVSQFAFISRHQLQYIEVAVTVHSEDDVTAKHVSGINVIAETIKIKNFVTILRLLFPVRHGMK